jgi:uncharacterized protein YjaZ
MDPMPCQLHILDADGRLSAWRPRIRATLETVFQAFRARAAGALHQPLSSWGDWFFGDGPADIPRHAGYALGHAIVQARLQGHGQTAAAAWDVPADRFITEVP